MRLRKVLDVTLVIISFLARALIVVSIARHGFLHLKPLNLFTSHLSETLTTQGLGVTGGLSLQHDQDYHGSCARRYLSIYNTCIISFNHRGIVSTFRPRNHIYYELSFVSLDWRSQIWHLTPNSASFPNVVCCYFKCSWLPTPNFAKKKNFAKMPKKFHHFPAFHSFFQIQPPAHSLPSKAPHSPPPTQPWLSPKSPGPTLRRSRSFTRAVGSRSCCFSRRISRKAFSHTSLFWPKGLRVFREF